MDFLTRGEELMEENQSRGLWNVDLISRQGLSRLSHMLEKKQTKVIHIIMRMVNDTNL